MAFELRFLGATGTVTGSKYLLKHNNKKILIDCGLFQGLKTLRLKNWDKSPVNPSEINAIILTHAHMDHAGYIPRFIKEGFKGPIYSTPATKELCEVLLPDSGRIMEEDAGYLNRHKKTKHTPALPLFTVKDAQNALQYFETIPYNESRSLNSDIRFQFHYVGHILGAASVIVEIGERKIAFTGDIGRQNDRIFYPPEPLPAVDYLVTESTYGDRLHKNTDTLNDFADTINETYERSGVILIPAFAVGRAQSLMMELAVLKKQKRIPDFPMYLNSPMATNVSQLFCDYNKLHRLSNQECTDTCEVVKYVKSVEESKALNDRRGPMLIISASGMLTGGRILHHLKTFAPHPQNTILLTGYQAAGTRGRALEQGTSAIKIHGEFVPVKAQVKVLHNMSAHGDYQEIMKWFSDSKIHPMKVFVTHGEASAADAFRRRLTESFGWQCIVPSFDETVSLE